MTFEKSMRKYFFTLALLFGVGACAAQGTATRQGDANASKATAEADSIRKSKTDRLYLQLYGGTNKSANEHMPWSEFSHHPWSGGAFVAVGQELTPLWGWRATFGVDGNKSRNVPRCEDAETWGWTNLEWWADATFDLTDALRPATRGSSPFNVKLFAGLGALYTFNFPQETVLSYTDPYSRNSKLNFGMRAGVNATYAINDKWRVGAQLSHFLAADQFNGVDNGKGLDMRSNLKVGLTYVFGPRQKGPVVPPDIIMAHRLKDAPPLPLLAFDPEGPKERQLVGRSFLDFPVNETIIYPKYRRNPEELKRIYESVEKATFDKGIEITSIELHGYASPESPYSNNTRLAKGRVAALAHHLQERYGIRAEVFDQKFTPEDWDNLRSYLADNDPQTMAASTGRRTVKQSLWYSNDNVIETPVMPEIVQSYRDELISVIDSDTEPDAKEEVLKKVGGGQPYKWLLKNVYPGLRHTDYIINYVVKTEYQPVEGRRLIYTHPEAMSLEEIYRVVNSYRRGTADWYEAIIIAARQHPDNPDANYNAAVASVVTHRLKDARRYIEGIDSDEADYLRDVISAMEGTVDWKLVDGKVVVTH